MTISMYRASVPVFIHMLSNLSAILDKGAAYAELKKIDPAVLINSRLFPDMFALNRQVQIATDVTKGCAARLAGQEPPSYADTETTFPELKARIDKTIAFLKTFKPEQIDSSEEKTVSLRVGGKPMTFLGLTYLQHYVLPNLYFHTTTAYGILRHNGVEIGKKDFLGKF
ncbi:MAG: DUF1993 domain-containing protein [Gammaproteobacteria bacterium]|nr:DUF1993 domain-containing protein [Gammaproteobacteria bacterium]